MKMRKILATLAAAVVACSALVVSASAADEKYNGYFQIQTNTSWWYRDAWNNKDNGLGKDAFKAINVGEEQYGTITDTEITGDGTYTVKVEGLDDLDFSGETISILGVSTNVPYDADLQITNVTTSYDGKVVNTIDTYALDPEAKDEYLTISTINLWSDPKVTFEADAPKSSIEISFTIKGLDAPAAGGDDDNTNSSTTDAGNKNDADDSNKPTGATAGLALAGLALAGVAVVAAKKSK